MREISQEEWLSSLGEDPRPLGRRRIRYASMAIDVWALQSSGRSVRTATAPRYVDVETFPDDGLLEAIDYMAQWVAWSSPRLKRISSTEWHRRLRESSLGKCLWPTSREAALRSIAGPSRHDALTRRFSRPL